MIGAPARLLGRMGSPRLLVIENSPSGRYLGYALFTYGTFAGADPKRKAGGRLGQSAAPSAALRLASAPLGNPASVDSVFDLRRSR